MTVPARVTGTTILAVTVVWDLWLLVFGSLALASRRVAFSFRGFRGWRIFPAPCAGGGGGMQGRISVSQTLCTIFVCKNLGVFEALHGFPLCCACAQLCHGKGFG